MQSEATISSGKNTAGENARSEFDLASPYQPGKAESALRAKSARLQKDLAKARSIQGAIAKSDLLKNSNLGDVRHKRIEDLRAETNEAIARINSNPPTDPDHLVRLNIIHPTLKRSCDADLDLGMTTKEIKDALQVDRFNPDFGITCEETKQWREDLERPFFDMLDNAAAQRRKNDWIFRIGEEMEQSVKDGRYPFMITLTYARTNFPHCDPKTGKVIYESASDMWKKGREVQYYLDAIAREVCKEMEHPAFNRDDALHPRSYYLQKFAMQEHGQHETNDHIHMVVWLREIPSEWKQCPNRYIYDAAMRTHRRCLPLESFWKWGFCDAQYFRHINDIWSKLGFVVPLDKKTGKTIPIRPAHQAGGYFVKYLSKERKKWPHRAKVTRGLGMARIDSYIRRLNLREAQALTWRPPRYKEYHEISKLHCVPMGLIRYRAKLQVFYLQMMQGSIDPDQESTRRESVFSKMLSAVREGDKPFREDQPERYNWLSKFIRPPPDYSHERQLEAYTKFGEYFPPKPETAGERVSIPGGAF